MFQEVREVEVGGLEVISDGSQDDIKMDIRVRNEKEDGTPRFEAEIYNLAQESWQRVTKDGPAQIRLGWLENPLDVVVSGIVQDKYPREDGRDRKFVVKGVDQSKYRLENTNRSHTWNNATPGRIAADIAGMAGIATGQIESGGGTIQGRWPICKDQPLPHWLDELTKEAAEQTGTQYEWHVTGTALNFVPKESTATQAVQLIEPQLPRKNGNAISVDEATGKTGQTDGPPELEFEMLLDPRVQRDGLMHVQTSTHSGIYRVAEYTHQSTMTGTGRHVTTGILAPTGAQYRVAGRGENPASPGSTGLRLR